MVDFLNDDPWAINPIPQLQDASWTLSKCTDCGAMFHRRVLTDEWLQVYYSEWISNEAIAEYYEMRGKLGFQQEMGRGVKWIEHALSIEKMTRGLRKDKPVRVLDFGCGEGAFLSACGGLGFEGVGVEFSAAREATKQIDYVSNLEDVESKYGTEHFDAVTLFQVLEHLTEPRETLRQLNKHLKTGGVLILETPNCIDVTGIGSQREYRLVHPLGHVNAFTASSMTEIAQQTGFERVNPAVVQVSAEPKRIVKREARRILAPLLKPTTDQVFVKVH